MNGESEGSVRITSEGDLISARKATRSLATRMGFGITDITRIVTVTSELARNILNYAGSGIVTWKSLDLGINVGIELVFEDHGPGIANIELAMQEGYSSTNGLGLGLPGSRRLVDQMEVRSELGKGTTVIVRKFRNT